MERRLFALTLLGTAIASGPAAAVGGDQQDAEAPITFPFMPPSGQVLHYRVTKSAFGGSSPPDRVLDQDLTFSSVGDGYELQIRTISAEIGGRKIQPASAILSPLPMTDIVSVSMPITLRLNPVGRVISVADWDKLRDAIRLIPEQIPQSAPAQLRARVHTAALSAIQPIVQLDERSAWTFVAADWPPVLTYGGALFQLDKSMSVPSVHYAFDGTVPVKLMHHVMVSRSADGGLTLDEAQLPDTVDFAAAVSHFYDSLAKSMSPESLAARRAQDASLQRDLERSATIHIETDSGGILRSGFWEVKYQKPDGTVARGERVTFERLADTSSPAQ